MATQTTYPMPYALQVSLREHLQSKMIDSVPVAYQEMLTYTDREGEDRVLEPSLIKLGRLQDDPTNLSGDALIPSICISIHYHDPGDTGDGWKDGIASSVESSMTNAAFGIPAVYEIGGGTMWWRRIVVEFSAYYIDADLSQSDASRMTAALRGCLEKFCDRRTVVNTDGWRCSLADPLGETSVASIVVKDHMWEGGGPADDYIWRGSLWVQVMTERA